MSHVLIMSLGPVQEFIATARKCRDLWFGSWLLSELAKAAAASVARQCGAENLVFPAVNGLQELAPGTDLLVANKIVVRVLEGIAPVAVAKNAEEAVAARLKEIRADAFKSIRDDGKYFQKDAAIAQVDDLIECAWACAAANPDYATARKRAEAALAARKNTRLWGPVPKVWAGPYPKSHLDGARESVLHENLFQAVNSGQMSAEDLRRNYKVDKAERLCGIGLLKRHGRRNWRGSDHLFVSTGHLAAWPLLERISSAGAESSVAKAWKRYLTTLEALGVSLDQIRLSTTASGSTPRRDEYDGSILFEGRVADLVSKDKPASAAKALHTFFHESGLPHPDPYYAVLKGDGDRMGRAIAALDSPEQHQALSLALAAFSGNARKIVEKDHRGELIYSGGDDVLAFVPLERVLACASALAKSFESDLVATGLPFPEGPATLSIGIGVSHFLEPMKQAIETAGDAEKLAKTVRGSLAVVLDKRSGGRHEVVGRWGELDNALETLCDLHVRDLVPDGAAYELSNLTRLLDGLDAQKSKRLSALVEAETTRILARKHIDAATMTKLEILRSKSSAERLARLLIVARAFARAAEISGADVVEVAP